MASQHEGTQSCQFPKLGRGSGNHQKRPLSVRVELQRPELLQQLLARETGKSLLVARVQAAWALVLRTYTGLDQVCFASGEVGGTSVSSAIGDDGQREIIVSHFVGDEVLLEELAHRAEDDASSSDQSKHENLECNTSVLFRFAAQGGISSGSSKITAMIMSDSVSSV